MTAISSLTAPPIIREYTVPPGRYSRQPRGASTNYFPRGLAAQRIGSDLAEHPNPSAPRTDLIVLGVVLANAVFTTGASVDSTGGALDVNGQPQSIDIETGTIGWFDTGTGANLLTNADVGRVCFLYDNNTLYKTDLSGTISAAGFVAQVRGDGKVKLRIDPAVYLLAGLPSGVTSDDSAGFVATNLPAGTFSGGVFTVTATGAFPTQDGATIALGDKVVFPLGTIGSQAVSAANEGPYECTVVGATGVQAVFTRPARFAHGATITPGTKVTVGGEGTSYKNTVWVAKPATATKIVGTDDPLMFPAEMIVPLTCSGGTASTGLVPLRGAGLFFVGVDFTGGSPAATTTNIVASTQTPGGIGTASIVIQEQAHLGTLVNTGTATANVIVRQ